jgi:hypothetical protein
MMDRLRLLIAEQLNDPDDTQFSLHASEEVTEESNGTKKRGHEVRLQKPTKVGIKENLSVTTDHRHTDFSSSELLGQIGDQVVVVPSHTIIDIDHKQITGSSTVSLTVYEDATSAKTSFGTIVRIGRNDSSH